jgi:hypothetical protein
MATKMIGAKATSRMKITDYPAICQERNCSLSFTLLTDSLITKLASALVLWKYAGRPLFLTLQVKEPTARAS